VCIGQRRRERRLGASAAHEINQNGIVAQVGKKSRRGSLALRRGQLRVISGKERQAAIKIGEEKIGGCKDVRRGCAIGGTERQVAHGSSAMMELFTDRSGGRASRALVSRAHQVTHRGLMQRQAAKGDDQQE
jgi:hypothetical protein